MRTLMTILDISQTRSNYELVVLSWIDYDRRLRLRSVCFCFFIDFSNLQLLQVNRLIFF